MGQFVRMMVVAPLRWQFYGYPNCLQGTAAMASDGKRLRRRKLVEYVTARFYFVRKSSHCKLRCDAAQASSRDFAFARP
jgi:hypothetical protein